MWKRTTRAGIRPLAPQARGRGEAPDSGFVFHPEEQGDDYEPGSAADSPLDGRNPTTRDAASGAAVPGSAAGSTGMTGLPKNRLFEQRLPPGFRAAGSGQPRGLAGSAKYHDLVSRFKDRPAESKKTSQGFFQNVAGKSKASAPQPTSNPPKDPNKTTNPPPPPKPSTTRLLTEGEKQLVKSIFGDSIKDLDKVEIRNRKFIPIFQRSDTTMTPNGNIYPAKDLRHVKDFSQASLELQAHFIHEMTHVWQKQDGMSVKTRGLISWMAPYDYKYEPGKDFRKYRLEQQATMIADYFLALRGEKVRPQSGDNSKWFHLRTPAEYEALIPWLKDLRRSALKPPVIPSPQPLP